MRDLTVTAGSWTLDQLLAMPLSDQQQAAAAAASAAAVSDDEATYTWSSRLVQRGSQLFAVFGSQAYELHRAARIEDPQSGGVFEYLPLLIDGRTLLEQSDYSSGIATFMRCVQLRGEPYDGAWMVTYLNTGWIRTDELQMTNAQISERIADEIDRGANHITGIRSLG